MDRAYQHIAFCFNCILCEEGGGGDEESKTQHHAFTARWMRMHLPYQNFKLLALSLKRSPEHEKLSISSTKWVRQGSVS